jgi:transposase
LKRGGAPDKKGKRRRSKLDPFKEKIDWLLSEGVWNAVVILREVQAEGYEGGISILLDYIRPKRPLRLSRAMRPPRRRAMACSSSSVVSPRASASWMA